MAKIKVTRREVNGEAVSVAAQDALRGPDPVEVANRVLSQITPLEPKKTTFHATGTKLIRLNGVNHIIRGTVENNFTFSTSNPELIEKMIELGYHKA